MSKKFKIPFAFDIDNNGLSRYIGATVAFPKNRTVKNIVNLTVI